MLRGHESLTRLVGKRRRLHPASILSHLDAAPNQIKPKGETPSTEKIPRGLEHFFQGEANEPVILAISKLGRDEACQDASQHQNGREVGKENSYMEWVQCPICGKNVQGTDSSINSHLDFCLLGETKCKNNQLTLSHFGPVPSYLSDMSKGRKRLSLKKGKRHHLHQAGATESRIAFPSSSQSERRFVSGSHDSSIDVAPGESVDLCKGGNSLDSKQVCGDLVETLVVSVHGLKQGKMILSAPVEESSHTREPVSLENSICNCSCHTEAKVPGVISRGEESIANCQSSQSQRNKSSFLAELVDKDTQSNDLDLAVQGDNLVVLETRIVGRKFNQGVKIEKGLKISAIREPENPKDPNAIKIVGLDSQDGLTIGHLPRELAFHLACLMDKGILQIQGLIVSEPEKTFEAVPVKLLCEKRSSAEIAEADFFEKSWQKVLQVVEKIGRQELGHSIPVQSKYQQNFIYFVKTVLERESHLFSEEEHAFLGSFFSLSEDAQRLFVRLYQRKGPWFRISQITYADISSVRQASDELLGAGFLIAGDSPEKEECLEKAIRERMEVLNVPELKQLISMGHWKKKVESGTAKREELLDWMVSAASEKHQNSAFGSCSGSAVVSLVMKMIGVCVRVSDTASFLLWRLQRLFFLNGEQDLSAFLLVDMGTIKYPTYNCSRTRHVFETREALLAYEQALEVAQAMDMALEANNQQTVLQYLEKACIQLSIKEGEVACLDNREPGNIFLARFSAAWVYATVVTLGVSFLERERRYVEAVELLKQLLSQSCCPGRRGYWTVRLSMDLEHLGCKEESLEVAEAGLNDPRIRNGDRVALQRRVLRLGKPPRRWRKPPYADAMARTCKEVCIRGRPLNCITGIKSRFYGFDGQQCSVEKLALQFYAGEAGGGWQGVHSESGVWMTLFGLLMWDVLFADIPNVFLNPFQTAPLDLNTDAFYPGRVAIIEAQLSRIQCGEASQLLAETWSKWYGTFCKGVNWDRYSLEELQAITSCIGGPGLASVCRLLAEDHAGWTGGMPDLLLWRIPSACENTLKACSVCSCPGAEVPLCNYQRQVRAEPVKGEAKLVEVKGPRDRLSEQQRAWILTLMEAGLCVEVCKVLEQPKTEVL